MRRGFLAVARHENFEQAANSHAPRRLTRRQLLCGSGALLGTALLAACAPPPDSVNATNSDLTSSDTGTSPVASPESTPTADASNMITEATNIPESTTDPANTNAFAQESIALVNQARREAGLEPLTESPVLTEVAQRYSERMANEGFYGHEDPQGNDVTDRIAEAGYLARMSAENIASGQPDAATVVEGWLNSPGHRANIMNPELREIGAGYAYTSTPPYHHYWTHVFATPDASVGRDRSRYPEEALAQINALRQQAGIEPLAMDPTLQEIATTHLDALVQVEDFGSQVEQTLNEASQATLQSYRQAVALSAAGPGSPEDVVTQWAENNGSSALRDAALRAAGVAYFFREPADAQQDEYRHYWLLVLGGD